MSSGREIGHQESTIQRIISRIQEGDQQSSRARSISNGALQQSKRLSRLSSINDVPVLLNGESPNLIETLTAARLIRRLPASPVLLRFLPPTILHFAPFLGSATKMATEGLSSAIDLRLQEWLERALVTLKKRSTVWLENIGSIRDVQILQDRLFAVLAEMQRYPHRPSEDELGKARAAIQKCCSERMVSIWQTKLDHMLEDAKEGVIAVLHSLKRDLELQEQGERLISAGCCFEIRC